MLVKRILLTAPTPLLILNGWAKEPVLNQYYENVYLGEKKTVNYRGPLDPRAIFSDVAGGLVLLDDIYRELYLNEEIQPGPFELHQFWFKDIVEKSTCPDETLAENMEYIRYLYRLVSMSYLFESLRIGHKASNQLGAPKICSIDYNDLFGKCSPKSEDMKKFKDRVYGKFVNEISKTKVDPFSKKEKAEWLEELQKSTSLTTDPLFSRLHEWCIGNKKNCRSLPEEEIQTAIGDFCKKDTDVIQKLCAEKDQFYGLNQIEKATELIRKSNAFNIINQTGMGEECLRRYSKLFSTKEIPYLSLNRLYPLIYSHLLKTDSRYIQGELFLPGSLKEFDMKGLSDFLTALKPPKVEPIIVKPKPRPKAPPKVVIAPEPVVEKPVEVAPVVVVEAKPEPPKLSEFESKALAIREKGESSAVIDMEIFRDDFEFSQEMMSELAAPMKKFQTRAALNDMKAYDLLGSKEAPVGLVFLKYLLDTDNHQGLFNILTVLGEKFYVVNDIEKKESPLYMHLKNDASTNNRWQIVLLKDPAQK